MKKRFLLILVALLWCNVGFAKDLTGKIIYCENWRNTAGQYADQPENWQYTSFEFLSANEVEVISVSRFKLKMKTYNYIVEQKRIEITLGQRRYWIDRQYLTLNNEKYCSIVEDKNINIREDMKKKLQILIDTQEKLNKI